ncbi:unnamed protein product [Medioppia subpectinata]|uniref:CUB domain-containing protein n=1 Tax=Medioppia subpectinata TaxID=1979941 RepID=A0A7R9PU74_9ACAR|nr:unnamed protein product [Medioppia subpectinata]CAG2101471.1 unnamed protein product [Medioppia subpectinata]
MEGPGYPIAYYNNIQCGWTVRVPHNHAIAVQFIEFETEKSDYLTMRCMSDTKPYHYWARSGRTKPSNLLTIGNTIDSTYGLMDVLFESDDRTTARGFKIAYKAITLVAMNGDRMSGLLDYDSIRDRFVWFDPKKRKFIAQSATNKHEIDVGDGEPNSLAIDWIHDLLYWLDTKHRAIKVLSFSDPHSLYTIHNTGTETPRDLVLNLITGALVWSNIGFEANIMQTHLDGSNRTLVYDSGRHAMHLTVDYGSKQYYFIDRTDHSLYSIDFWGKNETFIMKSVTLFDPIVSSLQVFGNDLYFNHEFFLLRVPDIQLGIERAQPNTGSVDNPCDQSKCSQLCLPSGGNNRQALKRDLIKNTPDLRLNPGIALRDIDDNENKCNKTLTNDVDSIDVLFWPNNTNNNQECEWSIQVPTHRVILFKITDISVNLNSTELIIYNGPNDTYPVLRRLYNIPEYSALNPYLEFLSSGNTILSDEPGRILMQYSAQNYTGGCIKNLTNDAGNITIWGDFDTYPCSWYLTVSPNMAIMFKFSDSNVDVTMMNVYDVIGNYTTLNLILLLSIGLLWSDPGITTIMATDSAILRANSNKVKIMTMNSNHVSKLMDCDSVGERVVWFDPKKRQFIAKFGNNRLGIDVGDGEPNSLAIDWIHDLLYWLDSKDRTIKVLRFSDPNSIYTIYYTDTEMSRDLVLNIVTGALVWSNIGFEVNIVQTHLDGSNRTVVYDSGRHAMHLTVNYGSKQYYFIDRTDHSLYSIDFWGKNETFIMKSRKLFDPIVSSLQVFGNDLYFAHEMLILRVPDIQLDLSQRTNTGLVDNSCDQSKCSQLCLPSGGNNRQALKRDLMRNTPDLRQNPGIALRDIDDNENIDRIECNQTLTGDGDRINVQFTPNTTLNNQECYWNIQVPHDMVIIVNSIFIRTKNTSDVLIIYNGANDTLPYVQFWTGLSSFDGRCPVSSSVLKLDIEVSLYVWYWLTIKATQKR